MNSCTATILWGDEYCCGMAECYVGGHGLKLVMGVVVGGTSCRGVVVALHWCRGTIDRGANDVVQRRHQCNGTNGSTRIF